MKNDGGPRISRRRFLGYSSAALAAHSGVLPAFAQTAAPTKGGHFRMGFSDASTAETMDPSNYASSFISVVGRSVHAYLTEVDSAGNLVGDLAESWDVSADAKSWTFRIPKGVEFHNGKTLTPDDVMASINYHRGPDSRSAVRSLLSSVTDVVVDGDNVRVDLAEGNADFGYILDDRQLPIMPSKDGTPDVSGVGAGGYQLESTEFGVKVVAKRFANYWKPNQAWFDSIEALAISDVAARTNALTSGRIDAMDYVDLKTVRLLERNPSVRVVSVPSTLFTSLPMLTDVAPYDNLDVRLAIMNGIDRQKILDNVFFGYGQIGNDHPIAPSVRFHAKDLPQRAFDPDQAKFHWKKAGIDSKLVLSASDAPYSGAVDLALVLQQSLSECGIPVEVTREPRDGYWSNIWMKKPWCVSRWGGRPTVDWMLSQAYLSTAKWNESNWKNENFDKLLLEARSELDAARRQEIYTTLQSMIRDEGGTAVPIFMNYVFATSQKVAYKPGALSHGWDNYRAPLNWWFA